MVRRIFVEKKAPYAVKAKELKNEMGEYLGIEADEVRVLIRYDVENVSDATFAQAKQTVFSEPPVDDIYDESPDGDKLPQRSLSPPEVALTSKRTASSHRSDTADTHPG